MNCLGADNVVRSALNEPTAVGGRGMSGQIIVVDTSQIHEGKLDELKAAIEKLAEFVEANEVEPIAYNVYFDEDASRMTVLQIHPSSASMELHLKVAGPIFRTFAELVTLTRVDIYGRPSEALLGQMRLKGQLLGNAPVAVHELHAGFARFARTASTQPV
jgi:hypothetical protein